MQISKYFTFNIKYPLLKWGCFLFLFLIITSCGSENTDLPLDIQGFHMQGRDCLACHNYDLQYHKHLTIGGTVFKTLNVKNIDDLNLVCGGKLKVIFIDINNPSNIISSADYYDPNSKGYNGKGNIFILKRIYPILQGDFYIQITDENGNVIAVSNTPHRFNSGYYDINNPADINNRYSCNSCHSINPRGGASGVIYPNINPNLCK